MGTQADMTPDPHADRPDTAMPIDLHHAAGESSAGELTPSEQAAFAALAATDPSLDQECAFWRSLRSGLAAPAPDPALAPGPHFPATVWQRNSWHNDLRNPPRPVIVPLPRWLGIAVAAGLFLTIGALVATGLSRTAPSDARVAVAGPNAATPPRTAVDANTVYQDDGGQIVSPNTENVNWANYMPLATVHAVNESTSIVHAAAHRPWLGLWTKPVDLAKKDGTSDGIGHLVVQVASNGPADDADIVPGDVILAIDGVRVRTPHCVADHLVKARPGDQMLIRYWSCKTATVSEIKVTLGCVCE